MGNKLVVIGLDGATFDVLNPLLECGQMKNLAKIIETGARSNLLNTYPPITGSAWVSFATGKNPGKLLL